MVLNYEARKLGTQIIFSLHTPTRIVIIKKSIMLSILTTPSGLLEVTLSNKHGVIAIRLSGSHCRIGNVLHHSGVCSFPR